MGSILPGNIRVLNRLGETPEGVLYRAEYSTGLKVALLLLHQKIARQADDPVGLLRRQQQIQKSIQIQHPNVAAVYEVGETGGSAYVVMEHLTGELLSDVLAARGALQFEEALDLWRQTAAGLHAAHMAGLVHGNLSPRTILITKAADRDRRVKLIRFPLLEPQSTRPTDPQYASPERISGQTPDESGDVFSLGALLHRLLTGRPPDGSAVRSLPHGMSAVLAHALASAPATRFQTVAEFATAVERASAPASRPQKVGANRSLVAIGVTLVVITAGLWLPWGLRRDPENGSRPAQETATRAPIAAEPEENASRRIASGPAKGRSPPAPRRAPATVKPANSKKNKPSDSIVRRDSAPQPKLSSFRRSHPWAAVPGKRFYFGSSCPLALQATDLVYFKTEQEARASGFVPSRVPGCY